MIAPALCQDLREELYDRIDYRPHVGQAKFHDCEKRFKVLAAGTRFGKSLAAAREVLPYLLVPGSRGWIVGPTYRLADKEFRYLYEDLCELGVAFVEVKLGGEGGGSKLVTAWGSEVQVVSAHRPSNLLGEELDWMLISEASQIDDDVFERVLRGRLVSRQGCLVIPTTPNGFNWVHELFLRGLDPDHPEWASFQFATADNPLIPESEIAEAKRTLAPETFAEQFLGSFTRPSGLVYPELDIEVHVAEEEFNESEVEILGAIDFGYQNPFVLLSAARFGDNRLLVYDEYFAPTLTVAEHVDRIGVEGLRAHERIFADPSGAENIQQLHLQSVAVEPAFNNVSKGIDWVKQRLRSKVGARPALVIHPRCRNLLREFTRYSWEGKESERPLKKDDHALDALRYLVAGIERVHSMVQLK